MKVVRRQVLCVLYTRYVCNVKERHFAAIKAIMHGGGVEQGRITVLVEGAKGGTVTFPLYQNNWHMYVKIYPDISSTEYTLVL